MLAINLTLWLRIDILGIIVQETSQQPPNQRPVAARKSGTWLALTLSCLAPAADVAQDV